MGNSVPVQRFCECHNFCKQYVFLPIAEVGRLRRENLIIIVKGCQTGPEPTDELVEKRKDYSIFRPSE